jgi:hypothetical protein
MFLSALSPLNRGLLVLGLSRDHRRTLRLIFGARLWLGALASEVCRRLRKLSEIPGKAGPRLVHKGAKAPMTDFTSTAPRWASK